MVPAPRRLQHLPALQAKARQVNHRLLLIERAGQGCAIESALFERISQPYARDVSVQVIHQPERRTFTQFTSRTFTQFTTPAFR
jgi:hypothetical protein